MSFFKKKKSLETNSMYYGVPMVTIDFPDSTDTEQFNTIRTNIKFSNVDSKLKSLMFSSATASEGKSTVTANVAASFSKQDLRTILVDADFRRSTVRSTFNISSTAGATNFLTNNDFDLNKIIYKTSVDNLYVLPSGPTPPNPSELIGSRSMLKLMNTLYKNFDMVIYDAPPILSVTDAQLLASNVDGTILVVRDSFATKDGVKQAVGLLQHVDARILGTILNDVTSTGSNYYGYYGEKEKHSNKI
ncbi:CpsD/CapB family tyrosine-protein kinase [Ligilactobacillus pobuzihii]|uniref:Tyrosine-protein kinase CpsD n=1 Tax=Ligilactobacillus pobuzihii TaxID=449659 RepID=A0A0R2LID7_9LACO|nr:CpsD/CapB family tyrosine-protein kinase [Ligilactobacillus pobuzihii]KRK09306.1 tyrosine-protein kinase [Ligilactobacillus pobuzihii E100301 = KCTC 13174]KRO01318.1 tyrosine-protein kinase [Ligilactobacillus pobuzihii]GEN49051.1 tyrosine protein kinase [Ligilactobacillus pobuzihii]